MSKIKDTLLDEQTKKDHGADLSYEHDAHTEFTPDCYECSLEEKAEKYDCNFCHDTGIVEIYGEYRDEWVIIDTKECYCQKD